MEWFVKGEANAAMGRRIGLISHQPQCDCVQHFAKTQNKYRFFFASPIIRMHHLDINMISFCTSRRVGGEFIY